jgi:hypothetical protein
VIIWICCTTTTRICVPRGGENIGGPLVRYIFTHLFQIIITFVVFCNWCCCFDYIHTCCPSRSVNSLVLRRRKSIPNVYSVGILQKRVIYMELNPSLYGVMRAIYLSMNSAALLSDLIFSIIPQALVFVTINLNNYNTCSSSTHLLMAIFGTRKLPSSHA